MNVIESIHERFIISQRARVLGGHISRLVPFGAAVLDIGCGDGLIAQLIRKNREDIAINGIDTIERDNAYIPVRVYDGAHIPYGDGEFDYAMLIDVLHHTSDLSVILREACRVSRRGLIIKDHISGGVIQDMTLRLMDYVGNARFSVDLPYNYWTASQWDEAFRDLRLRATVWNNCLGLYPFPLSQIFERKMHFMALLEYQ